MSPDVSERERLLVDALVEQVEAQELDRARELAPLSAVGRRAPDAAWRSVSSLPRAARSGRPGPFLQESLDLASGAGDDMAATRAALAGAVLEVRLGDGVAALRLLDHAGGGSDPEIATDVLTTTGIALWLVGDPDRALSLLGSYEPTWAGTPWEADLLGVRGMVSLYAGRLPEALRDLDAAVSLLHLWRPSTNQSRIFALRSTTRFHVGDWDGAAVDAAAARALAEGPTQLWSAALALAVSVDVPAHRGRWEVAEDYLSRALDRDAPVAQVSDIVASHAAGAALAREDYAGGAGGPGPTVVRRVPRATVATRLAGTAHRGADRRLRRSGSTDRRRRGSGPVRGARRPVARRGHPVPVGLAARSAGRGARQAPGGSGLLRVRSRRPGHGSVPLRTGRGAAGRPGGWSGFSATDAWRSTG